MDKGKVDNSLSVFGITYSLGNKAASAHSFHQNKFPRDLRFKYKKYIKFWKMGGLIDVCE